MANKKISQLTGATTPLTGTEELAIVQGGQTLKATAQDVADLGGGGTLPVETVYPTTDALKAGTRFWYKGNEWHYMTADEIDSAGWTGLVSVGFPAPVSKVFRPELYQFPVALFVQSITTLSSISLDITDREIDLLGIGMPNLVRRFTLTESIPVTKFRNASLLKNLEDVGTSRCVELISRGLTDIVIDDFFTQLPLTTKTATLDVRGNSGSLTCDPTIATAKGYTVITS